MRSTLLSVDEVAARLGCHPHTVRRWIWDCKLKAVKVGDLVRVSEEEVAAFMRPVSGRRAKPSTVPKGPAALLALMREWPDEIDPADVELVERALAEAEQPADWRDSLG